MNVHQKAFTVEEYLNNQIDKMTIALTVSQPFSMATLLLFQWV